MSNHSDILKRLDAASTPAVGDIANLAARAIRELEADAKRYRLLRRNVGKEYTISQFPSGPHTLRIDLDATGCEKYLRDGAVDFPSTLDAILDDEAIRAAAMKGDSNG